MPISGIDRFDRIIGSERRSTERPVAVAAVVAIAFTRVLSPARSIAPDEPSELPGAALLREAGAVIAHAPYEAGFDPGRALARQLDLHPILALIEGSRPLLVVAPIGDVHRMMIERRDQRPRGVRLGARGDLGVDDDPGLVGIELSDIGLERIGRPELALEEAPAIGKHPFELFP